MTPVPKVAIIVLKTPWQQDTPSPSSSDNVDDPAPTLNLAGATTAVGGPSPLHTAGLDGGRFPLDLSAIVDCQKLKPF